MFFKISHQRRDGVGGEGELLLSLCCRFWLLSQFVFFISVLPKNSSILVRKKKKIKKSPVGNLRTLLLDSVTELGGACVLSRFSHVRLFLTP